MQRADAHAIERFGIPRLLLMDHAGAALARAARPWLSRRGRAVVCCGTGYNGGDGLCAAWYLAQEGARPRVLLMDRGGALRDEPAVYFRMLRALRVPCQRVSTVKSMRRFLRSCDVILDALLGIGLRGAVRPSYAAVIQHINASGRPVVAADVPSGLDADEGEPLGCAVRATITVTFGAAKRGLAQRQGPAYAGRVIVEDIGIPARVLRAAARLGRPRRRTRS